MIESPSTWEANHRLVGLLPVQDTVVPGGTVVAVQSTMRAVTADGGLRSLLLLLQIAIVLSFCG